MRPEVLSGWGRTSPSAALVVEARDEDELVKAASEAPARGVVARGLGRSYNDAAQNAGGLVLDATGHDRFLSFDDERGVVRAAAGVTIGDLIAAGVPRGCFPPVTPGTKHVTVGGAIAADVHGKNHHVDGSFARFVESLRIWTPAEGVLEVGPDDDVFWATCGGMGLTGVVLDATIRMKPVETSAMVVDTDRVPDLDGALAAMESEDERYTYSVAWMDFQAGGRSLGRSVLTRGRHATVDDLPPKRREHPHALPRDLSVPTPPWVPNGLVNRLSVRAFNELWYRKAPARERGRLQSYGAYFYPLDLVAGWNRLYGRRGFIQYQLVVPFGQEAALRDCVERLAASRTGSFLAVLKRFGAATPGHLSFPTAGWTLALDFAVGPLHLRGLLDDLDRVVADAGGRCYLAKDGRSRPSMIPRWYPRLDEWRAIQRRLDPAGVLRSDLARRLDLLGDGEVV